MKSSWSDCSLKVAAFQIPMIVDKVIVRRRSRVGGRVGQRIDDLWSSFCRKQIKSSMQHLFILRSYTAIFTSPEQHAGVDIGNGSYSGMTGIVQRGEANVSFVPYAVTLPDSVVLYSPVTNAIQGKTMHFPNLHSLDTNLIENIQVFSKHVTLLLLTMNIVLGITFKLLGSRRRSEESGYVECQFETSRCMVNQNNVQLLKKYSIMLVSFLLGVTFIVMEVFEQAINADKVAKDFSVVVNSIDDFLRLKEYPPCMIKNDPFTEALRRDSTSDYREVWRRAKSFGLDKTLLDMHPSSMLTAPETCVFFGNQYISYSVGQLLCKLISNKMKPWIGQQPYAEMIQAFYEQKETTSEDLTGFNLYVQHVAETGLINNLWKYGAKSRLVSLGMSNVFHLTKMDELYDNVERPIEIGFFDISLFTVYIILALVVSVLVLIAENVRYSLR